MGGLIMGQTTGRGFVRSALVLTASIAAVALVMLPYAMGQAGSAGPIGLAAAAAICLLSGWAGEALACLFARRGAPLAGLLAGMAARLAPPLGVCLILAAQGVDGRRHLAFVCYLLAFYLVTLALETWLAVKRVNPPSADLNHGTR